jgi:hypothetical protein
VTQPSDLAKRSARQLSAKQKVKVYGERNTGTNYVSRLISLNFDVHVLRGVTPPQWIQQHGSTEAAKDQFFAEFFPRNLGWKHALPRSRRELESAGINTSRILFVTITKNPYSWLLSMFKRPYHWNRQAKTFSEFLSMPWTPIRRENCDDDFLNPVDLWNRKNRSYVTLFDSGLHAVNLRYEDLVCDPMRVLKRLNDTARMPVRHHGNGFVNVVRSTKDSDKDFEYYRDYYTKERWRDKLSANDLQTINSSLDRHLMRRFGYELL